MARRTTGTLYKRGKIWWGKFDYNGETTRVSLGTTSKPEARKLLNEKIAPLTHVKDEAAVSHAVAGAAKSDAEKLEDTMATLNRTRLERAWAKYPYDESLKKGRRKLPEKTVEHNRRVFEGGGKRKDGKRKGRERTLAFLEWVAEYHKELAYMEDITEDIAQAYSGYLRELVEAGAERVQRISNHRHNVIIGILQAVWDKAGIANPWATIERPDVRKEREGREPFSDEQIRELLIAAGGDLETQLLILLGAGTGLRLGDVLNLQWRNIHHDQINVKTSKAKITVSIPLSNELDAYLNEIPLNDRDKYILPKLREIHRNNSGDVPKMFKRLVEKTLDIEASERQEGRRRAVARFGFHSLRHSFITYAAANGIPLATVAAIVGHCSTAMTMAYNHAQNSDLAKLRKSMNERRLLPSASNGTEAAEDPRARLHKLIDKLPTEKVENLITMVMNELL